MIMPVGLGGSHGLLATERQDNEYAIVDVGDCFVCLGREDGEVDRVLFGRVESGWPARVEARHGEGLPVFSVMR
jgi:hypothetical protein